MRKFFLVMAFVVAALVSSVSAGRPSYKNPVGNEFPILAWYSILPDSLQTSERYAELREAGFNLSFAHIADNDLIEHSLDAAKGSGVKLMIMNDVTRNEAPNVVTVERFMHHPSLGAYYLRDEPHAGAYGSLRKLASEIYDIDPTHMVYVNLFPNYLTNEQLGAESYEDYVRRSVTEANLSQISFDHYPVLTDGNGEVVVRPEFYENFEIVSKVAKEQNVPFWAFALSSSHGSYPIPNNIYMRLEAFAALAYGAQGLQYFTYYQPFDGYIHCPVDFTGKRTEVWYLVRDLNREIQALAPVFLGAELVDAWHTGKTIPRGTKRLSRLPDKIRSITSDGEGLLVSHLVNGKKNYLMIVNRDIFHSQTVTIDKDRSVKRVEAFRKTRVDKAAKVEVGPGDYLLYTW